MKNIKFAMETDLVGCGSEEIFEFDDDVTDEEIEEELKDWVWNQIDAWYEEVED